MALGTAFIQEQTGVPCDVGKPHPRTHCLVKDSKWGPQVPNFCPLNVLFKHITHKYIQTHLQAYLPTYINTHAHMLIQTHTTQTCTTHTPSYAYITHMHTILDIYTTYTKTYILYTWEFRPYTCKYVSNKITDSLSHTDISIQHCYTHTIHTEINTHIETHIHASPPTHTSLTQKDAACLCPSVHVFSKTFFLPAFD